MVAAFNALPRTADTTEGFFSRWIVVPFEGFFPAGIADITLIDRLTAPESLRGLLRGAVGGLQQVMRRGAFTLPLSVANATERFKREADPLRGFLEERVEFRPEVFTPRSDIYTAYTVWAGVNGFHVQSAARFYESLTAAAIDMSEFPIRVIKLDGTRGYRGIALS